MAGVISEVQVSEYPKNKANVVAKNKANVVAKSPSDKFTVSRARLKHNNKIFGKGDIISRGDIKAAALVHMLMAGIIKEA